MADKEGKNLKKRERRGRKREKEWRVIYLVLHNDTPREEGLVSCHLIFLII